MVIFLLRRLSHRGRRNLGLGLVGLGLALVVLALTLVPFLLVHGLVVAAFGAAVVAHAVVNERRARLASEQAPAAVASSARPLV